MAIGEVSGCLVSAGENGCGESISWYLSTEVYFRRSLKVLIFCVDFLHL